jgi:hypothetical protein
MWADWLLAVDGLLAGHIAPAGICLLAAGWQLGDLLGGCWRLGDWLGGGLWLAGGEGWWSGMGMCCAAVALSVIGCSYEQFRCLASQVPTILTTL